MQAQTKVSPRQQVHHGFHTKHVQHDAIEDDLAQGVGRLPCRQWLGVLEQRPQPVKHRVQTYPHEFGKRVAEEAGLKLGGSVGVNNTFPQVAVVISVVLSERDGHGQGERQVGPDAKHAVHPAACVSEGEVVTQLVQG